MKIALVAVLTVFCALVNIGCATKRFTAPAPKPIQPPTLQKSRAAVPFSVTKFRENITIQWDDCAPQPEGTFYRLYDCDDLESWAIYADTFFRFIVIPVGDESCHFFKVSAISGEMELFGGKDCP